MLTLQRQAQSSMKPIAGLAAAVSLAMIAFASGLAAMDHIAFDAQHGSAVVAGTFGSESQGDYRPAAAHRFAPQRSTTR